MLARESDKLATTSRRRGNRGYGIKKYTRYCVPVPPIWRPGPKRGAQSEGRRN